jgi:hypothetical protein
MKNRIWIALVFFLCFWPIALLKADVSDLTYTLPEGWKAAPESWGVRFVAPDQGEDSFKPEVTLRVRKGSQSIDDTSGKEFSEVIKKQLAAGGWTNINLQSPRVFEFRPDFKGLLYYANIEANGNPLVQSIAVISSKSEHYVFTFTDVPEYFEAGKDKAFQESFALVKSFNHADGWSSSKVSDVLPYGLVSIFLVTCLVAFLKFRAHFARRDYERLAQQVPDDSSMDDAVETPVLQEVTAEVDSKSRIEKDEDVV